PLRLLLFAFIEVAVITSAVRARRNMRENFSAGIDGIAVWALTGLTAVLSCMDARSIPEAVFRLAAPLVAAWLWERGMAIERHRITGRKRINWRATPERFLVWVGLAESQDRTADEVDRQRRFTRVALAAKKVRVLVEAGAKPGKVASAQKKLETAYAAAHAHTGLGRDPELQEMLAAEVRSLFSAGELVSLEAASAWTQPVEETPSPFEQLANETRDLKDSLAVLGEIRATHEKIRATRDEIRESEANILMLASQQTSRRAARVTPDVTPGVTHTEVTPGVTKEVTNPPFFPPREWLNEAPAVTPPATPAATPTVVAERVTPTVTFDITNPAAYDIKQSLLDDPSVTEFATPAVTPPAITGRVTKRLTFKPKAASQPKTVVMRAYWDKVRSEEKRYPDVVELAKASGAHHSLASRKRTEWVLELPYWERKKANAKKAVNGSKPS
ncbi:hypothetical protein AB0J58_44615, partial [Streptosporangium sp. NPDC049644]